MSEALLELRDVQAGYGPIKALHGISLDVAAGEIVTMIGANGAGKSSTLRAISGVLAPTAGSIRFAGKPIGGHAANEIVRLGISHSPEGRQVFPRLTVLENLELGAYTRNDTAEIRDDLKTMHDMFPILAERAQQLAGTLSGGEQQMLALARALMSRPKLLLLDEPSLGLAPLIVQKIFAVIRELNSRGIAVLLVEQNAKQALKLAQRGYVLESGQITCSGPALDLLNDKRVQDAYLGA
jgi:branched-chain amino acid transport system ATP-binding protein